jgi:ATP synthase protein I
VPSSPVMHPLRDLGRYGTVGIELIVSMALGYYGGRWLDGRWGAGGWLTAAGALIGVVIGFYSIWKASQTMGRDIERAEKQARREDP